MEVYEQLLKYSKKINWLNGLLFWITAGRGTWVPVSIL